MKPKHDQGKEKFNELNYIKNKTFACKGTIAIVKRKPKNQTHTHVHIYV